MIDGKVGYTGGYMHVRTENAQAGEVVRVRITGVEKDELRGEMIR